MYLFVISKVLGLFFNAIITDDKYCIRNGENFLQPIQKQLHKKESIFLNSLVHFGNLRQSLIILKKR